MKGFLQGERKRLRMWWIDFYFKIKRRKEKKREEKRRERSRRGRRKKKNPIRFASI